MIKKLYQYQGYQKTWIMCRVCYKYEVPSLEFVDMFLHLVEAHPHDCYSCRGHRDGFRSFECDAKWINHSQLQSHNKYMNQLRIIANKNKQQNHLLMDKLEVGEQIGV